MIKLELDKKILIKAQSPTSLIRLILKFDGFIVFSTFCVALLYVDRNSNMNGSRNALLTFIEMVNYTFNYTDTTAIR